MNNKNSQFKEILEMSTSSGDTQSTQFNYAKINLLYRWSK